MRDARYMLSDRKVCEGIEHCRRSVGYSFMPLVQPVRCPVTVGACRAESCAALALARERVE